jgi:cytochrome c oxidase subunit 3
MFDAADPADPGPDRVTVARDPARRGTGGIAGVSPGKIGMWVFLATDTMGFGGLLLAYALLRVRAAAWPDPAGRFDRSLAGALTFVLLLSGATMSGAVAAARAGKRRATGVLLASTAIAGAAFVAGQAVEFRALATGRHLGLTADHAAALFYVICGYHGLHVLAGVVVLALLGPGAVGARAARRLGALEVASLYWQFVDLMWIVIFTALYLLPPVGRG